MVAIAVVWLHLTCFLHPQSIPVKLIRVHPRMPSMLRPPWFRLKSKSSQMLSKKSKGSSSSFKPRKHKSASSKRKPLSCIRRSWSCRRRIGISKATFAALMGKYKRWKRESIEDRLMTACWLEMIEKTDSRWEYPSNETLPASMQPQPPRADSNRDHRTIILSMIMINNKTVLTQQRRRKGKSSLLSRLRWVSSPTK